VNARQLGRDDVAKRGAADAEEGSRGAVVE
jgi:hypothetical protein